MLTPAEIRAARQARGLTQIQAAVLVGVSYPAFRLWEMGGTKPTEENERRIREKLKIREAQAHGGSR